MCIRDSHYTDEEVREMILRGPLASNSVLAPMLYSRDEVDDVLFVEGFSVTQLNHNTIAISVKEKQPVGCIPYLDSYIYFDRSHQVTPRNRDHTRSSSDARRAIKGCSPKIQSFSTVEGTGSSYVRQAATSSIAPKASQSGLSV